MKKNPMDNYCIEEGQNDWIEDCESGERLLFIIDEENEIVFRSMLEEDVKKFVKGFKAATGSQKRKTMRELYEVLPKEKSQEYYFSIERIVGERKTFEWDEVYGLWREPIGIGYRSTAEENLKKHGYNEPDLEAMLYDYNLLKRVIPSMKRVARIFNIPIASERIAQINLI